MRTASRPADLQVGYSPMDADHDALAAKTHAVLQARDAELPAAWAAMAAATRLHFETEEGWMTQTAFPATACHADEHAAVLRSLAGVGRRVAAGNDEAARSFAAALLDWLPGHVDTMDAALAHWLCRQRHGGQPVALRRGAAVPA